MSRSLRLAALLTPALAVVGLLGATAAADAQAYYGGVANVSVANGNAVIIRGDSGAQVQATINAPLVAGDYIATGPGGDAEVQFDGVSMLRLAPNSQVRFVNLSPNAREMQVASGTVLLAETQGSDGSPQIDTPSLTVRPNQSGDYRVSVFGNDQTLVTVRSGAATVSSGNGSQTLTPGSTLVAYGSYSNPSINAQAPVAFDNFDQFNISRDQAMATAYNSNPYVSPQLAGYSNFANYGQWQNVPGYGEAWAPYNQNQNNFAPYQNGQWVWEPGYGYTWVDNAPYGYATSHYGTWFNNPNYGGWNWQPPGNQYQNTSGSLMSAWLPAVVSFFLSGNGGSNFDLSSLLNGFSSMNGSPNYNIGWIPLAPGEQYTPWYGQNYSYPQTSVTTVPNVTNIYNYYSNARYYRGAAMIPVSDWRAGNFRHITSVRPQQLRQIYLIRGAVPVVPTTANLHYTTATVSHPVVLSHTFSAPHLVAKAPAVTTASFTRQVTQLRQIAVAKPKVVPLSENHTVVRPVYHPVTHAPVHVEEIKPVPARVPQMHVAPHTAAPSAAAPKAAAPKAAVPATREPAKPSAHPTPAEMPAARTAPPVERPVTHPVATERPATRTAPPAERPVTHPVATERPAMRTAPPAERSVTHPVTTERPVMRTAPPAERTMVRPQPTQRPMVQIAPTPRPVIHAAPTVRPATVAPHPVATAKPAAHPEAAETKTPAPRPSGPPIH